MDGTYQTGSSSSQVHVSAEWRPIDQGAPFEYRMIGGRSLWTPSRWRNQLEHFESTSRAFPIIFAMNGRLSDPMISRPIIPPVMTLSAGRAITARSPLGSAGACCLRCWGGAPPSCPCWIMSKTKGPSSAAGRGRVGVVAMAGAVAFAIIHLRKRLRMTWLVSRRNGQMANVKRGEGGQDQVDPECLRM